MDVGSFHHTHMYTYTHAHTHTRAHIHTHLSFLLHLCLPPGKLIWNSLCELFQQPADKPGVAPSSPLKRRPTEAGDGPPTKRPAMPASPVKMPSGRSSPQPHPPHSSLALQCPKVGNLHWHFRKHCHVLIQVM